MTAFREQSSNFAPHYALIVHIHTNLTRGLDNTEQDIVEINGSFLHFISFLALKNC